ncbi:unnamed protein product [Gongylonema pulchrum]|uniref:Transposase n=1 Tax=Gongylonema pulchrum TaxID=637853 RepID=A0A183D1W7_9BILA|nr:unnamed protein product [Gongylonema pulchrum]
MTKEAAQRWRQSYRRYRHYRHALRSINFSSFIGLQIFGRLAQAFVALENRGYRQQCKFITNVYAIFQDYIVSPFDQAFN